MAIGSANRDKIITKIRNRESFNIASMSAATPGSYPSTGCLSDDLVRVFRDDKPTYVVYSYGTPIAWTGKDGRLIVPVASYSVTTSGHQGIARQA